MSNNLGLIAVSEDKERIAEERFAQSIFNTLDTFVGMYNMGLLNRSADETKELLDLTADTYKNVSIAGGKRAITIQSEQEFMAHELSAVFAAWSVLSLVKREALECVNENTLSEDDTLFLSTNGTLYRVEDSTTFETDISRVAKHARASLLEVSSLSNSEAGVILGDDEEDDEDYNGFNISSEGNEAEGEFSLEESPELLESLGVEEEKEEEEEKEKEKEKEKVADRKGALGRELTEEDVTRMLKVSDITSLDNGFISDIYAAYQAH